MDKPPKSRLRLIIITGIILLLIPLTVWAVTFISSLDIRRKAAEEVVERYSITFDTEEDKQRLEADPDVKAVVDKAVKVFPDGSFLADLTLDEVTVLRSKEGVTVEKVEAREAPEVESEETEASSESLGIRQDPATSVFEWLPVKLAESKDGYSGITHSNAGSLLLAQAASCEECVKKKSVMGTSSESESRIPTFESSPSGSPSANPWNLKAIYGYNEDDFFTYGGSGIKVAVVDSGVNAAHPDLEGRVTKCKNFTSHEDKVYDECSDEISHGTSVAGIIAATKGPRGKGLRGVSPGVEIWALKACGEEGCYSDDVAEAIYWAVDQGVNIIVQSIAGDNPSNIERNSVKYAVRKGVLVISSAGNGGGGCGSNSEVLYPAAYPEVVAVGSVGKLGDKYATYNCTAEGKNDGDGKIEEKEVELAAPGSNLSVLSKTGYSQGAVGTSFAAPHIAALAAKQWQGDGEKTRAWLVERAKLNDVSPDGEDNRTGYGFPTVDHSIEDRAYSKVYTELKNRGDIALDYETAEEMSKLSVYYRIDTDYDNVFENDWQLAISVSELTKKQGTITFTPEQDGQYELFSQATTNDGEVEKFIGYADTFTSFAAEGEPRDLARASIAYEVIEESQENDPRRGIFDFKPHSEGLWATISDFLSSEFIISSNESGERVVVSGGNIVVGGVVAAGVLVLVFVWGRGVVGLLFRKKPREQEFRFDGGVESEK